MFEEKYSYEELLVVDISGFLDVYLCQASVVLYQYLYQKVQQKTDQIL
jgi:hypothetical protein